MAISFAIRGIERVSTEHALLLGLAQCDDRGGGGQGAANQPERRSHPKVRVDGRMGLEHVRPFG